MTSQQVFSDRDDDVLGCLSQTTGGESLDHAVGSLLVGGLSPWSFAGNRGIFPCLCFIGWVSLDGTARRPCQDRMRLSAFVQLPCVAKLHCREGSSEMAERAEEAELYVHLCPSRFAAGPLVRGRKVIGRVPPNQIRASCGRGCLSLASIREADAAPIASSCSSWCAVSLLTSLSLCIIEP